MPSNLNPIVWRAILKAGRTHYDFVVITAYSDGRTTQHRHELFKNGSRVIRPLQALPDNTEFDDTLHEWIPENEWIKY